jgi:hypothetical protein
MGTDGCGPLIGGANVGLGCGIGFGRGCDIGGGLGLNGGSVSSSSSCSGIRVGIGFCGTLGGAKVGRG